jgi:hypothetical protein
MHNLSASAKSAVGDLRSVYAEIFSPTSSDTVVLAMLDSLEAVARRLQGIAASMGAEFESMAEESKCAVEMTQRICASRRDEMTNKRMDRKASEELVHVASASYKFVSRAAKESDTMLKEARCREWWSHKHTSWISLVNSLTRVFQPLLGMELQMRATVAKAHRETRSAKMVLHRTIRERQVQIQRKSQVMQEIVHLVQTIRNASTELDTAAILVEALHQAIRALKRLSAVMLKMAALWAQLERHCVLRLASPDEVSSLVRSACLSIPEHDERRKAFLSSGAFKRRAVLYQSRWVATAVICGDFSDSFSYARRHLYYFLESHPGTYSTVADEVSWD